MNLFATVLTYPAPSANYRGESELNRTVIQKVSDGRLRSKITTSCSGARRLTRMPRYSPAGPPPMQAMFTAPP